MIRSLVSTYTAPGVTIDVRFDLDDLGDPSVSGVTVSAPRGRPVDPPLVRQAPVGAAIAAGFDEVAAARPKRRPLLAPPGTYGPGGGRPRKYADEHYEQVAGSYAAWTAAGDPAPVQHLATVYGVPYTTASGWVQTCRERGLLAAW